MRGIRGLFFASCFICGIALGLMVLGSKTHNSNMGWSGVFLFIAALFAVLETGKGLLK